MDLLYYSTVICPKIHKLCPYANEGFVFDVVNVANPALKGVQDS